MDGIQSTYDIQTDDVGHITQVDFSIYNNRDVLYYSAINDPAGITMSDIYRDNIPVTGGVFDTRMGITDRSLCATCGEMETRCPGHFGHIKFVEPVFHIGFINILRNILSCICIKCNKLLIDTKDPRIANEINHLSGKERFHRVKELCGSVNYCQRIDGCGIPAHKITVVKKNGKVYILGEPKVKSIGEDASDTPRILTPKFCRDTLKSVSYEDCVDMGLVPDITRPEDMVIENFPVPPVQVRPSVRVESIGNKMDDLTHKLLDIVKKNESLKNTKGDGSLNKKYTVDDNHLLLQYHVATFYSNGIVGVPKSMQKNKTVTKSMSERLKGKEGRIRGNLMGKRVNMSGRSVITSDPNIGLNDVGIPILIAKELTFPEIVTPKNIDFLRKLVKNGPNKYPGANTVITSRVDSDGNHVSRSIRLDLVTRPIELQLGDKVERHLMNGDMVIFNRQPSLHKLSVMGHQVHVIINDKLMTFRLNVNVTAPYNADFDGDEMNTHIPQSIQTMEEVRLIANASKRFIHPGKSSVAINAKQDTAMGSFVLTMEGNFIDWKDMMNILMVTDIQLNYDIPKHKLFLGNYLYSAITPNNINIQRFNSSDEVKMRIRNGVLEKGVMSSGMIASVIQELWNQSGGNITTTFIDNLQRVLLQYLMIYGYTVGVGDTQIPDNVTSIIHNIIETKRKKVANDITQYENDPYTMDYYVYEQSVTEDLKSIMSDIQDLVMNNLGKYNGIRNAILSGSSGAPLNSAQIIGCVGQVIVERRRIQKKFNNRSLPLFAQHDDSPFARGFCYNSLIAGLNPSEFFFQTMAGREGTITTAIKTQETGYMQRKFIKFLEDIRVEYDGTVRNSTGRILQYAYGDSGISTEIQVKQRINIIAMNNKEIADKYTYSSKELSEINKSGSKYTTQINDKLYKKMIKMRDRIRAIQRKYQYNIKDFRTEYMMPIDLHQKITNIVFAENRNNTDIVDPYHVLQSIKNLHTLTDTRILTYDESSIVKKNDEHRFKFLAKLYLFDVLNPKRCTHLHKLSRAEFDDVINHYITGYKLARVNSGEMVGILGAHSIGEPVTQTNLKSFHVSGSGKNVTVGLTRVKEVAEIAKKLSSPITNVVLEPQYQDNKDIAEAISSHLKHTSISDITENASIYYDENPDSKSSLIHQDGATNIFTGGGCQANINNLPWGIRITLSREQLVTRKVTMMDIKTSFCDNWARRMDGIPANKREYKTTINKIIRCAITSNFDNSETPVVHIRFDAKNYNFNTLVSFQDIILNTFKIKGINGVTESKNIKLETYNDFDKDGNLVDASRYVIHMEGINMQELIQINGIDMDNTTINDVVTTYELYGIEAARTVFIKEFTLAVESSHAITGYHHIELLADAVTHMGTLIAVNRHGVGKLDTDIFAKASFEQTVDKFQDAAIYGESDYIRNVSSQIMVGELFNGGTGAFDILIDHDKIKAALPKSTTDTQDTQIVKKNIVGDLIRRKKKKKQNK